MAGLWVYRAAPRLLWPMQTRRLTTGVRAARINNLGDTSLPRLIGFEKTTNDVIRTANANSLLLTTQKLFDFSANATPRTLLKSANFLHRELPIRVAQRLVDFQQLPFIIGCNPNLRDVYELYSEAYVTLSGQERPETDADQIAYTNQLKKYLDHHMNVITMLAHGVKECKRVLGDQATAPLHGFLNRTITSRIGLRLLIENQVALDHQAKARKDTGYAGVICRALAPTEIISEMETITQRMCHNRYGVAPKIRVRGDVDAVFSYVPGHLEYILQEVFKNAMRATVEHHRAPGAEYPDVEITICRNDNFLILRISDQGGGISPDMLEQCWNWSFTTVDDSEDNRTDNNMLGVLADSEPDGPLAGLGFGLPMARLYAQYFGGSLEVIPMHGYGTDVFLTLKDINASIDHRLV